MSRPNLLTDLRSYLKEIQATKQASVSDPGGHGTTSSHPTTKLEDNTSKPSTGTPAAENDSAVKSMIPTGAVIGDAPASTTSQTDLQTAPATPVGDDPAVEQNYSANDKDPGTTHPAKFSMGEKYGSYRNQSFAELCKQAEALGNQLLARTAVSHEPRPAVTNPAAQTGYDLAKAAAALTAATAPKPDETQVKTAATQDALMPVVLESLMAADLTAAYLKKANWHKRAEGMPMPPDAGAMPMPPDAGGAPPMPPDGGAAPPMAPAGPEGAAPGGEDPSAIVDQVLQSLLEMGIPPDLLMAKLTALQGGGGGASPAPPADAGAGAGGEAPPAPKEEGGEKKEEEAEKEASARVLAEFTKVAAAAEQKWRKQVGSGVFGYKAAKDAKEQQQRSEIKDFVREVFRL